MGKVLKDGKPIAVDSNTCTRSPLQQLMVEAWGTIREGGIVLLGEVHDNPEHHAVRGEILWPRSSAAGIADALRPAAVFEHIRTSQQAQIDEFYRFAARSRRLWRAPDLLRLLNWKETGWPAPEMFYPLFDGALWSKLPIYPGNADRTRMRAVVKDPGGADMKEAGILKLAGGLPPELVEQLDQELAGSHCGMVPQTAIAPMSLAQRYTDAHLADVVIDAAAKHGAAFLMAGNGHVRTDRAVPWYVRQLAPGKPVAAVMLVEVEDGKTDPAAYLVRGPDGRPAADYVLFTPQQPRPDPCEKMRRNKP